MDVCVFGYYWFKEVNEKKEVYPFKFFRDLTFEKEGNYYRSIRDRSWKKKSLNVSPVIWNKLYKKSFIRKNKLSFEKGRQHGEDGKFISDMFNVLNKISFSSDNLYYYRKGRGNSLMDLWYKENNKIRKI